MGVALPPLADGVLEEAEAGKGYIGYYDGGAFGLPSTSKQQKAAALFLQYIGQDEVQPDWAVAAPRVTNKSTYADPKVQAMNKELGGYYDMLKDKGYNIARRTIAKYREQLGIPVARLRKEL